MSDSKPNKKIYTAQDIRDYLEGKLSPYDMREMELASLSDPFLADALEGYMVSGGKDTSAIRDLKERLQQRIDKETNRGFIFPIWMRAAAVISGLALTVIAVRYFSRPDKSPEMTMIVQNQPVTSTPRPDSVSVLKNEDHPDSGLTALRIIPEESHRTLPAQQPSPHNERNREPDTPQVTALNTPDPRSSQPMASAESELKSASAPSAARMEKADVFSSRPLSDKLIKGIVLDENRQPLPGAIVQTPSRQNSVVTDNNGEFSISTADSLMELEVRSVGYQPARLAVREDSASNTIVMKPSDMALNEVVVSGYGTRKARTLSGKAAGSPVAEPTISWEAYNEYIRGSIKAVEDTSELGPEVVVSFMVNRKGDLSAFAIEKSGSDSLNKEAIRVIRQGPRWKVRNGRAARARMTIKFNK